MPQEYKSFMETQGLMHFLNIITEIFVQADYTYFVLCKAVSSFFKTYLLLMYFQTVLFIFSLTASYHLCLNSHTDKEHLVM